MDARGRYFFSPARIAAKKWGPNYAFSIFKKPAESRKKGLKYEPTFRTKFYPKKLASPIFLPPRNLPIRVWHIKLSPRFTLQLGVVLLPDTQANNTISTPWHRSWSGKIHPLRTTHTAESISPLLLITYRHMAET